MLTKIAVIWKINDIRENKIVPFIRCFTGTIHVDKSEKIFFQGAFLRRLPFVIKREYTWIKASRPNPNIMIKKVNVNKGPLAKVSHCSILISFLFKGF
jgi:hypothetical protein